MFGSFMTICVTYITMVIWYRGILYIHMLDKGILYIHRLDFHLGYFNFPSFV